MAITWRNIDAPAFGAANLLSQSAGNRINDGITQLQNLAMQQGNSLQAKQDNEKASLIKSNTEDVLNQIYALGDMNSYQEAIQSGEFDLAKLKDTYDGNVDLVSIRNALMNRDKEIVQQDELAFNYSSELQRRADTPLVNQFQQNLLQSQSPEAARETLINFLDSNASEEAKAAASQEADSLIQKLISRDRATVQFDHGMWRNSREYLNAELEDERRFIDGYAPDRRLILDQELNRAISTKESAESKYNIPPNFEDKIALGTGLNALNDWIISGTNLDKGVNPVTFRNEIVKYLNRQTFKVKDFETKQDRELNFQELPYWVLEESLQEIGVINKYFRDYLSNSQKTQLVKAIETNYTRYQQYDANLRARNATLGLAEAAIFSTRAKAIELEKEAAKEFRRTRNTPKNL